jgi:hypothetical protein
MDFLRVCVTDAHARLARYVLPSLASLSSIVTNIRPRGDWKQRSAGGTTLIGRQTPLIVTVFGLKLRCDLSRNVYFRKPPFHRGLVC